MPSILLMDYLALCTIFWFDVSIVVFSVPVRTRLPRMPRIAPSSERAV